MLHAGRQVVRLALALAVATMPAVAQQSDQDQSWKLLLSSQLSAEKRCDIETTVFVREVPSSQGALYSGRVRCIDGREFDFSQSKAHLKFELRACEPATC